VCLLRVGEYCAFNAGSGIGGFLVFSNVQEKIGKLVVDAYEKKEEANKLEEEAIMELEDLLCQN
jgi:hypothetical protein